MRITVKQVRKMSVLPRVTLQQAHDQKLFGPVYHGTYEDGHTAIHTKGFQVIDDKNLWSHGYPLRNYGNTGYPPPMHHLGLGVYFTTNKAIATKYNKSTQSGLIQYYLNIPRLLKINFAAPNTMMKWWRQHGYDFDYNNAGDDILGREKEWYRATKNMTQYLASQYDAVWFTGKGFRGTNLDGDQLCVYEPTGKVFILDNSGITSVQLGAKVRLKPLEELQKIITNDRLRHEYWQNQPTAVPQIIDAGTHFMIGSTHVPYPKNNIGTVIKQYDGDVPSFAVKLAKGGTHFYTKNMLETV